jgi:hypothetical protein
MPALSLPRLSLFAGSQLALGLLVLGGVWFALPARWLWVDVPATLLGVGCLVTAGALLRNASWALHAARLLLWAELVLGCLCVTLLASGAAQLAGSYGPVGAGGALLLAVIALLVVPYLVVFPALQLGWLRRLG